MSMLLNPYAFASGGGGGGTLPPGATSFLDFVNGYYYAGGSWQSVSALLGGGFDLSAISASGMYVDFSNANRPTPIGSLISDIIATDAAGMTVLFDVTTPSSLGGCLLYMGNNADYNSATTWQQTYVNGDVDDDGSVGIFPTISGAGGHKIAVTFNRSLGGGNYEYAWCHDGNAALTQTVGYAAAAVSHAQIGWDGGSGDGRNLFQTYIKSITLYPAIASASLPALTT